MPERLMTTYDESRNNPDLLSLREEAVVLETRLCELLKSVDYRQSEEGWKQAMTLYKRFQACALKKDGAGIEAALHDLGTILKAGPSHSEEIWENIQQVIEDKRRVVETIAKQELLGAVTIERVMSLFVGMAEAVKDNVQDLKARRSIYDRFESMITRGGITPTEETSQALQVTVQALPAKGNGSA
jgi:hypothetical protein